MIFKEEGEIIMCIKVAIVDDDDLIRESLKIIVGF